MIPTIGRFDMFQRAFASAIAGNARFVTEIIIVDNSQDSGFHSLVMEVIDEYKEIVRLLVHRVRLSMCSVMDKCSRTRVEFVVYLAAR